MSRLLRAREMKLKNLAQVGKTALGIAANILIAYLAVRGIEKVREEHPTLALFEHRLLSIVIPAAAAGCVLYYSVQGVRAFQEGVREAESRNRLSTKFGGVEES